MRMRLFATVAVCFICTPLSAQTLTDAQIDAAVKDTKAKVFEAVQVGAPRYEVVVLGPLARIARASRSAAAELKPFTRTDVTDDMRAPIARISAWPDKPQDMRYVTPAVSNIVIMPKGSTDVSKAIQPIKSEAIPQEWGNALGAKVSSEARVADFNLSDLPAGEFDVVIGCDCRGGPQRVTVKVKDRAKIQ